MPCPPATRAKSPRAVAAVPAPKRKNKKRTIPEWASDQYYTVEQCMEKLGFSRQYIHRLIGRELVRGEEKICGLATVTKRSVDDYLKRKLRVKGTR